MSLSTVGDINTNNKVFPRFAAGVVDTGGKFTAGFINTGSKFTAGASRVIDTGRAHRDLRILDRKTI